MDASSSSDSKMKTTRRKAHKRPRTAMSSPTSMASTSLPGPISASEFGYANSELPRRSTGGMRTDELTKLTITGSPRRSSTSGYERLSLDLSGGPDLPRVVTLGLDRSSFESSQSRPRVSSPSPWQSARRSIGHVVIKGAQIATEQRHVNELFAGNQALARVSAAPVSAGTTGGGGAFTPSKGFMDASVKCREADLKDRIIFFL